MFLRTSSILLAGAITGAVADFSSPYASYSGVLLPDGKTAQITVVSKVSTSNWVGLGFSDQEDPGMGGADLVLLYSTDGSKVTLQHNFGNSEGEDGLAAPPSPASLDPVTLIVNQSSYSNGQLTAVFTRPLTAANITIPTGPGFFLWATGPLIKGVPNQHTDKAVTSGSTVLINAAALPGTSGGATTAPATSGVIIASTTAEGATAKSSADGVVVGVASIILAAAVAVASLF
ncbi:hypothetical protein HK101_003980 [Irineochytrium annulatum]|nr:hypothetical protein HK101_003980 [Irineochytrium annulatum]